jgi:predicted Zn-dependent protease
MMSSYRASTWAYVRCNPISLATFIPLFLAIVSCSLVGVLEPCGCHAAESAEPAAQPGDDFGQKYPDVRRAILVFRQGQHDQARQILASAKSKHHELPPVDAMMARLYLSAGDIRKAEATLEGVVVEAPDDPEAFVLLGDLALLSKRYAFADLAYQRARQLLTKYKANQDRKRNLEIRTLAGLSSLGEARGQYDRAAEHLASWLAMDPKSPVALGSLGRVNFRQKKYDEARAAFTKLTAVAQQAPPVEIAMGRLYSDVGMNDEALQQMQIAAKNHAKDVRARVTIAEWAINNGLNAMAKENVDAALSIDEESVAAQVLSARLSRHAGDLAQAESVLNAVVLKSPNAFTATDELARTLAASDNGKKRKTAIEYARRNFQSQQRRKSRAAPHAVITYAWALFRNGQIAEAEKVLQALPDGSKISSENGYYVAKIYAGAGKQTLAINLLKALLSTDCSFPGREQAESLLATLTAGES